MNTTGKTGRRLGQAPGTLLATLGNGGRPMNNTIRTLTVTNNKVVVNKGQTPLTTPLIGNKAVRTQHKNMITT